MCTTDKQSKASHGNSNLKTSSKFFHRRRPLLCAKKFQGFGSLHQHSLQASSMNSKNDRLDVCESSIQGHSFTIPTGNEHELLHTEEISNYNSNRHLALHLDNACVITLLLGQGIPDVTSGAPRDEGRSCWGRSWVLEIFTLIVKAWQQFPLPLPISRGLRYCSGT